MGLDMYLERYNLDDEGYGDIEEIGYWRKANHIHNWFVNNIQGGVDNCRTYKGITKQDLEKLLDVCNMVMKSSKLVKGNINAGTVVLSDGTSYIEYEDGMIIEDDSVAKELLPCVSGFFFGSTDYDEYYLHDVQNTINIITNALKTTNFDRQGIQYFSSW